MVQIAFFKVGAGVMAPLSVLEAPTLICAKKVARELIETEGLDAVRIWVDGRDVVEVRPPSRSSCASSMAAPGRGELMLARRSQGAKVRDIAEEFGTSVNGVREALSIASHRARFRTEQPNRASLPQRALQALGQLIDEPETDLAEKDLLLPERMASLSRRRIEQVPNIGKGTVAKIEAWLWERGLTLS